MELCSTGKVLPRRFLDWMSQIGGPSARQSPSPGRDGPAHVGSQSRCRPRPTSGRLGSVARAKQHARTVWGTVDWRHRHRRPNVGLRTLRLAREEVNRPSRADSSMSTAVHRTRSATQAARVSSPRTRVGVLMVRVAPPTPDLPAQTRKGPRREHQAGADLPTILYQALRLGLCGAKGASERELVELAPPSQRIQYCRA